VNIAAVQKTLAMLVVTLFLVFGGFTVGLAQGTTSLGFFLTGELNHEWPGGAVQLCYTSPLGLASEMGGLSSIYKYQGPCQQDHVPSTRLPVDKQPSAHAQVTSHKVSLRILQSVFLL
jgi:hypothetical protein